MANVPVMLRHLLRAGDMAEARELAMTELRDEERRRQVDAIKAVLKARRGFWRRLFPWRIRITRI